MSQQELTKPTADIDLGAKRSACRDSNTSTESVAGALRVSRLKRMWTILFQLTAAPKARNMIARASPDFVGTSPLVPK
jgi:hypothetical protein